MLCMIFCYDSRCRRMKCRHPILVHPSIVICIPSLFNIIRVYIRYKFKNGRVLLIFRVRPNPPYREGSSSINPYLSRYLKHQKQYTIQIMIIDWYKSNNIDSLWAEQLINYGGGQRVCWDGGTKLHNNFWSDPCIICVRQSERYT